METYVYRSVPHYGILSGSGAFSVWKIRKFRTKALYVRSSFARSKWKVSVKCCEADYRLLTTTVRRLHHLLGVTRPFINALRTAWSDLQKAGEIHRN